MVGSYDAMLQRRQILLCAPLVLLAACGDGGPEPSSPVDPQTGATGPDVVVFLIDTLRADRTGPGGREGALTPVLDALAGEGVVFSQAHSPGPWTLPSVVSILTGRHIAEHNVVQEKFELAETIPILPQLLLDVGYDTANYHRNPFAGKNFGLDAGFQICEHVRGGATITGKTLDPMYDAFDGGPYFVYLHSAEPHDPHTTFHPAAKRIDPVSPEFLTEYGQLVKDYRNATRVDFRKRPLGTTDNTEEQRGYMARLTELIPEVENIYMGSVSVADGRVGSVIEKIKQRGRWDDTLFIVISDHGEEMSDHGGWQHDQSVYQELLHVPLVIRFPKGEYGGTRIDEPVSLIDLVPTVLDVVGAPASGVRLTGESLMPLVRGEAEGRGPQLVGMRNNQRKYFKPYKEQRGDLNLAVRDGKWKAIYNHEPGTLELYDLERDPGELEDLVATEVELAERLKLFALQSYADLLLNSERAQEGGLDNADQETLQGLEQLGYLGGGEEEEARDDERQQEEGKR